MDTRHTGWRARRVRAVAAAALAAAAAFALAPAAGASAASSAGGAAALPPLPDGVNVAIGAKVTADSGSAPASALGNIDDGDGSTRWCPSVVGRHTVTIDLGRTTDITGTGLTFSGEEGNDGSSYSVSTGLGPTGRTPFPQQAAGDRNGIVQGPLYLFAGTPSRPSATVRARYVTLTYEVPREQNICVQEFRVFADSAGAANSLQLGGDLTDLAADGATSWSSGATRRRCSTSSGAAD